jgi:hypothetical protein
MINIGKILILVMLAVQLSACKNMHIDVGWAKPPEMKMDPPPGPPIYQQGFKDGCESGFSGYAASGTKIFWKWKQDPVLAEKKVYYQIWKDAYAYCALYGMMEAEHGLGNWR